MPSSLDGWSRTPARPSTTGNATPANLRPPSVPLSVPPGSSYFPQSNTPARGGSQRSSAATTPRGLTSAPTKKGAFPPTTPTPASVQLQRQLTGRLYHSGGSAALATVAVTATGGSGPPSTRVSRPQSATSGRGVDTSARKVAPSETSSLPREVSPPPRYAPDGLLPPPVNPTRHTATTLREAPSFHSMDRDPHVATEDAPSSVEDPLTLDRLELMLSDLRKLQVLGFVERVQTEATLSNTDPDVHFNRTQQLLDGCRTAQRCEHDQSIAEHALASAVKSRRCRRHHLQIPVDDTGDCLSALHFLKSHIENSAPGNHTPVKQFEYFVLRRYPSSMEQVYDPYYLKRVTEPPTGSSTDEEGDENCVNTDVTDVSCDEGFLRSAAYRGGAGDEHAHRADHLDWRVAEASRELEEARRKGSRRTHRQAVLGLRGSVPRRYFVASQRGITSVSSMRAFKFVTQQGNPAAASPSPQPNGADFPAGLATDFASFPEWVRQYNLFRRLKAIPFFRTMRREKFILAWRGAVVAANMEQASHALSKSLLVLDKDVHATLMAVRLVASRLEGCGSRPLQPPLVQTLLANRLRSPSPRRLQQPAACSPERALLRELIGQAEKLVRGASSRSIGERLMRILSGEETSNARLDDEVGYEVASALPYFSFLPPHYILQKATTGATVSVLSAFPHGGSAPSAQPHNQSTATAKSSSSFVAPKAETLLGFNVHAVPPVPDYTAQHTFDVDEFVSRMLAFHKSHTQTTLNEYHALTLALVDEGCFLFQQNLVNADPDLRNPDVSMHVSSFTIQSKKRAIYERSLQLRRLCDFLFVQALVHNAVTNLERLRILFEDSGNKTSLKELILQSSPSPPRRRGTKFGQAVERVMERRRMSTAIGFSLEPLSVQQQTTFGEFPSQPSLASPRAPGRGRRSSINLTGASPGDINPTSSGFFVGGFDVGAVEGLASSPHFIAPRRPQRRASFAADPPPPPSADEEYFAVFPLIWVQLKIVTREEIFEEECLVAGETTPTMGGGSDASMVLNARRSSMRRTASMIRTRSMDSTAVIASDDDGGDGVGGILSRRSSIQSGPFRRRLSLEGDASQQRNARRAEKESLLQFNPDAETVTSLVDRVVASIVMRSAQVPSFFAEEAATRSEGVPSPATATRSDPHDETDSRRNLIVTHSRYKPAVEGIHSIVRSNFRDITAFCKPLRAWCVEYDELDDIILNSQSVTRQLDERDAGWYQDVVTRVRRQMTMLEGLDMYPRIGFIQLNLTPMLVSLRRKLGEVMQHIGRQIPTIARIRNERFLARLTSSYNRMINEPQRSHYRAPPPTNAGASEEPLEESQLIRASRSTLPTPTATTLRVRGKSNLLSRSPSQTSPHHHPEAQFAALGPLSELHSFVAALVDHFLFCASVSEGQQGLEAEYDAVKEFHRLLDDEPDLMEELDLAALRSADDVGTLQSGTSMVMGRIRERAAAFEQTREKFVAAIHEHIVANMQALKEASKALSTTLLKESRFRDASLVVELEAMAAPPPPQDVNSSAISASLSAAVSQPLLSATVGDSLIAFAPSSAHQAEVASVVDQLETYFACSKILATMEKQQSEMHITFGIDFTRPLEVREATGVAHSMLTLWKTIHRWTIFSQAMRQELVKQLPADMGATVDGFTTTLRQCGRYNSKNPALHKAVSLVRDVEDYVPIVEALRNKNLTPAHWATINKSVELFLRKRYTDRWVAAARDQYRRAVQLHLQRQMQALGGEGSELGGSIVGAATTSSLPVDPTSGYDPEQPLSSAFEMLPGAAAAAQQAGVLFNVALDAGNDTLQWLIDNDIKVIGPNLQAISTAATHEAQLDREITHVSRQWQGGSSTVAPVVFHTKPYKHFKDVFVLDAQVDSEVIPFIEESNVRTASALANRHCVGILQQRAERLQSQLQCIELCVRSWVHFQQEWIFLENIFGQPDISRQWPAEEALFRPVDHTFKEIMRALRTLPSVYHSATNRRTLTFFLSGLRTLEALRKALDRKVELKRQSFPRLYFLSDSDVLDMLALARNPQRVAPHYSKLFDGVKSTVQMLGSSQAMPLSSVSTAGPVSSTSFAGLPLSQQHSLSTSRGLPTAATSVTSSLPHSTSGQLRLNVIVGVLSPEGVYLPLTSTASRGSSAAPSISGVPQRGDVERWLQQLEHHMIASVRMDVASAATAVNGQWKPIRVFGGEPHRDPLEMLLGSVGMTAMDLAPPHPAPPTRYLPQSILAVSWASWCTLVETAFSKGKALTAVLAWVSSGLKFLTQLSSSSLGPRQHLFVPPSDPRVHSLLCALITQQVHMREVTERLLQGGVSVTTDFEWSRVLRIEVQLPTAADAHVVCRQLNTDLSYAYEFLGCQTRLVITPVTEKVYLTIMTALSLNMGAAPAGPAGTGKTETVKDLAKVAAKQCVVYNCSEGVTHTMTARLFAGLVQGGCWACLDEFNRIPLSVLSAVASQMLSIKSALDRNMTSFNFLDGDDELVIRPGGGVFITMNPGYAGRTELPDNLKSVFRPVAVTVPDSTRIAEVTLLSEGFHTAGILARRTTMLLSLCRQQLSSCDHYDFSMRALKSILVVAGRRLQAALSHHAPVIAPTMAEVPDMADGFTPPSLHLEGVLSHQSSAAELSTVFGGPVSPSSKDESRIVFDACCLCTVPKLLEQDIGVFLGMANDMFGVAGAGVSAFQASMPLRVSISHDEALPMVLDTTTAHVAFSTSTAQDEHHASPVEQVLLARSFTIGPVTVSHDGSSATDTQSEGFLRAVMQRAEIPCGAALDPHQLVQHAPLLKKTAQLYETLQLRFGVMVLGSASSGKTTMMDALAQCYTIDATQPYQHNHSSSTTDGGRRGGSPPYIPAHHSVGQYHRVNPKSMAYGQLFGTMNPTTGDWSDGVLVKLCRGILAEVERGGQQTSAGAPSAPTSIPSYSASQSHAAMSSDPSSGIFDATAGYFSSTPSSPEDASLAMSTSGGGRAVPRPPGAVSMSQGLGLSSSLSKPPAEILPGRHHAPRCHWVVFDGPVDTLWVESLNSVLDDSRLLCLDNGERLKLPEHLMRVLFEVEDLRFASPATVSRCGMVCLNPADCCPSAPLDKYLRLVGYALGSHVEAYLQVAVERLFMAALRGFGLYCFLEEVKGLPVGSEREASMASEKAAAMRRRTSPSAMLPQSEAQIYSNFVMVLESYLRVQQLSQPGGDPRGWTKDMVASLEAAPTAHEAALQAVRAAKQGTDALPSSTSPAIPWTSMLDVLVAYSTVWSIGCDLSEPERDLFDSFMRQLTETVPTVSITEVTAPTTSTGRRASHLRRVSISTTARGAPFGSLSSDERVVRLLAVAGTCAAYPPRDSVFDYAPPSQCRSGWQSWAELVPPFSWTGPFTGSALSQHLFNQRDELISNGCVSSGTPSPMAVHYADFSRVLVPTVDSVRLGHFITRIVETRRFGSTSPSSAFGNVVVCGDSGVGKTLMLQGALRDHLTSPSSTPVQMAFSFAFAVARFYDVLDEGLKSLHPEKKIVFVVDDANLPAIGEYGASGLLESLRYVVEQHAYYDRDNLSLNRIPAMSAVLCSGPPTTDGRGAIPSRLARHFVPMRIARQSPTSLLKVFTALLTGHFGSPLTPLQELVKPTPLGLPAAHSLPTYAVFSPEVRNLIKPLTLATIDVLLESQQLIKASQHRRSPQEHFTAKDAMRCLQGVSRADPQVVRTSTHLAQLWLHEVQRAFQDKLTHTEARNEWAAMVVEIAQRHNLRGALVQRATSSQTQLRPPQGHPSARDPHEESSRLDDAAVVAAVVHDGVDPPIDGTSEECNSQLASTLWLSSTQGGLEPGLYEPYLAVPQVLEALRNRLDTARMRGNHVSSSTSHSTTNSGSSGALTALATVPRVDLDDHVVLFPYCCFNACRLSRVLDEPRGSAMLVGSPGAGKRTIVKIAAILSRFKVVEACPSQKRTFRDYVVGALLAAAACGRDPTSPATGVVLLVSDASVDSDAAFEDVNCLLQGGSIPGLFSSEVKSNIFVTYASARQQYLSDTAARAKVEGRILEDEALMMEEAADHIADPQLALPQASTSQEHIVVPDGPSSDAGGATQTPDDVMTFFMQEATQRLRVVVCHSSDAVPLRRRAAQFPALLSSTTCMWVQEWPADALRTLAVSQLNRFAFTTEDLQNSIAAAGDAPTGRQAAASLHHARITHLKGISRLCAALHHAAVHVSAAFSNAGVHSVTSGKYQQFIQLAKSMLASERAKLMAHRSKMTRGVDNLKSTLEQVAAMEVEVRRMEPLIAHKTKAVLELTEDVKGRGEDRRRRGRGEEVEGQRPGERGQGNPGRSTEGDGHRTSRMAKGRQCTGCAS